MIQTNKIVIFLLILVPLNIFIIWSNNLLLRDEEFYNYKYVFEKITKDFPNNIDEICNVKLPVLKKIPGIDISLISFNGNVICSTEEITYVNLKSEEFKSLNENRKIGISIKTLNKQNRLYIAKKDLGFFIRGAFYIKNTNYSNYKFVIFFNILIITFILFVYSHRKKTQYPIDVKENSTNLNKSTINDYAILFNSIEIGVVIISDEKIVYFNKTLEKDLKIIGKLNQSYKLFSLSEIIITQLELILNGNEPNKEIEVDESNFLVSYTKIENYYFIFFNDITILKQNEDMKRKYVDAISHELKTPLTNILLYSEKLLDETDEKIKNDIEKIYKNGEALKKLINDILQLSKLDTPNLKLNMVEIPLRALFIEIMKELTLLIDQNNVDLEINIKNERIFGDRDLIYKAFRNLVENGVKYNVSGGVVTIEVKQTDDMIEIKISDTGSGISENDLKYIFDRFYRADKSRTKGGFKDGTGLGLSIVKNVIHLHKGVIHVDSKINEGTVFTAKLPLIK